MSTVNRPQCPTAEDALVQALAKAFATIGEGRLDDAVFGKFADPGAGWHWRLAVRREYASEAAQRLDTAETVERRIRLVHKAWEEAVARYAPAAS